MLTTLKLFGLSTVLACGLCANDAQACGGGRCGGCAMQPCCTAPAAMPMDTPAPPAAHQHNAATNRQRYQSAYQVPNYSAPMRSYGSRGSSNQFDASRKFLGRFGS